MICRECGYKFQNGDWYFDTDDGVVCEMCIDDYLYDLKWDMKEEYDEDFDELEEY